MAFLSKIYELVPASHILFFVFVQKNREKNREASKNCTIIKTAEEKKEIDSLVL